MGKKIFHSLSVKLLLVISSVVLITIMISIFFYNKIIYYKILNSIENDKLVLIETIKYPVLNYIKKGDYEALNSFIKSIPPSTIGSDLLVCDSYNNLVASNFSENKNLCENISKEGIALSDGNIQKSFHENNLKHTLKTTIDISQNEKIYLILTSDVKTGYERYNSLINYLIIGGIIRAISAVLLSVFFLRLIILKPLNKLKLAVENISKRNFDFHLDIKSNDEIGELARAFNIMAKILKKLQIIQEKNLKFLNEYKKAIDLSAIVIKSDLFGKITYINDIFKNITGYTEEEILGKSINELRGVSLTSDAILEYWDSLLNCYVWKGLICNKTKDKRDYYVKVTVTPVLDINDEVVEYIDIWQDVTEIYTLKKQLEVHKENLEHLVEQRTKELLDANRKLVESEKRYKALYQQSEKINETLKKTQSNLIQQEKLASIGQLSAGIAHELNNPIGFISSNFQTLEIYMQKIKSYLKVVEGHIEKLESLNKAEPAANGITEIKSVNNSLKINFILEDIDDIFKECEEGFKRVTSIINSLRSFARVEQIEEFVPYDINEGILNTLVVSKNEIKYVADIKTELGDVPNIYASGGQINQVLLNIIVNAAQAIESQNRKEKGNIYIRTYQKDNFVVCEIKDDGPGIPENIVTKIFDPFFTTKDPGKGTGLGLHIAYDIIVNKHNGSITVNSKEGEGAEFVIMLPIKQKAEGEDG